MKIYSLQKSIWIMELEKSAPIAKWFVWTSSEETTIHWHWLNLSDGQRLKNYLIKFTINKSWKKCIIFNIFLRTKPKIKGLYKINIKDQEKNSRKYMSRRLTRNILLSTLNVEIWTLNEILLVIRKIFNIIQDKYNTHKFEYICT